MRKRLLPGLLLAMCLPACLAFAAPQRVPPTMSEAAEVQRHGRWLATITLANSNAIELVLEGAWMPYTVANFKKLAQAKFYDGLEFYIAGSEPATERMPKIDLVQSGCPTNDGMGHPGYALNPEISPWMSHLRGALTMVRQQEPDTGGSQFMITRAEMTFLDGGYALFGWVKSGWDALDAIKPGDKIKTVTVAPYAGRESCPILSAARVRPRSGPSLAEIAAVEKQGRYLATITLDNGGAIQLVLEGKEMPRTVANFVKLAKANFYDGLTFHRVVREDGFNIIQGGCPRGDGTGGSGYQIRFEESKLVHKKGALAMARSQDKDSAGCQFYITSCEITQLDGNYAVFGWVKSGQELVDKIGIGDKMKSVTVVPYNGKEKCPVMEK